MYYPILQSKRISVIQRVGMDVWIEFDLKIMKCSSRVSIDRWPLDTEIETLQYNRKNVKHHWTQTVTVATNQQTNLFLVHLKKVHPICKIFFLQMKAKTKYDRMKDYIWFASVDVELDFYFLSHHHRNYAFLIPAQVYQMLITH